MHPSIRPVCLLLALALGSASAPVPGANAPAAGASAAPYAFPPVGRHERLAAAIDRNDAARARRLVGLGDAAARKERLRWLAGTYLSRYDALDALRLDLVRFLLEEGGLDIPGRTGTELLQLAVSVEPADPVLQPRRRAKQLTLARLAVAYGARAGDVLLGACSNCNAEPAFLALLLGAGADLNASDAETPALFNRVIETDDLAATERLIRLGADPGCGTRCRHRHSSSISLSTSRR